MYKSEPTLWREDQSWTGFSWIDVGDKENSVLSYMRRAGDAVSVVILNLTPIPRERYRVGLPGGGTYECALSSDAGEWGGSGYSTFDSIDAQDSPFHGQSHSVELTLPPLGALVLRHRS
jgi:1,4-alpha-glucan branching enzyme